MVMAALKHEKIEKFSDVGELEDYLLVAHCGYLGVLPKIFSTEWTLRPRVLFHIPSSDLFFSRDSSIPCSLKTMYHVLINSLKHRF